MQFFPPRLQRSPTSTAGNFFSSNKSVKYRRHTVSAVCTRTACNHRNSRKTESRNIHSHYGFLRVWFIDRHVLSELYVIYNFLNFPSTPQLFCHNSVICSEQNPTNYSSARAFEAFTAVHRSIKKDNRAWVIAQALLLMASPPHSLVWGVVDGNQKQWKAHHPLSHPCHNLVMWLYPLLLSSLRQTYIFNMVALFILFWGVIFLEGRSCHYYTCNYWSIHFKRLLGWQSSFYFQKFLISYLHLGRNVMVYWSVWQSNTVPCAAITSVFISMFHHWPNSTR